MYSVWKLCISKIKKNKSQNILIALIILLSTLLLQTALVIVSNTGNAYMNKHNELSGSHEILNFESDIHDPYEIAVWWQVQEGVTVSEVMKYRTLSGLTHNNNKVNAYLYMTDASSYTERVDRLLPASDLNAEMPEKGSVWIPTSLAYSNDISIGDELVFKTDIVEFSLSVSGIMVDLPYCSPFSTSARIWMNGDDYNEYIYNAFLSNYYTLSIRYDDYSHSRNYWAVFEENLGMPFLEYVRSFENLSSFYMVISNIIGFVMLFLAIVMIIIAIASIGFTISNDIVSNYKTIGITKSLGMGTIKPVFVYMLQYVLLTGFSVITGIIVSYFFSSFIVNSSLAYLRTDSASVNIQFAGAALGVFVCLFLAIIVCVFLFAHKARKILPVQAIKFGASEIDNARLIKRGSRISKFINFENLPVALCLGLRTIQRSLRNNLLIIIISASMTAVLVFGFCMLGSVNSIDKTIAMWGYDNSDLTVVVENMPEATFASFQADLAEDKRVKDFGMFTEVSAVIPSNETTESMSIELALVNGSYDSIGFTNIEGKHPLNSNEISIGINIAKQHNVGIGDHLDLFIKGEKHNFVITGIYQAIANMAYSARIYVEYATKDIVFINMANGVSTEIYAHELEERYGNWITATPQEELISDVFSTATLLLVTPLSIITIVFILVALIIIYCNCSINIKKETKTYGIYRSVGMHTSSIRHSIALGVLVLESIGALVGLVIGVHFLPLLLNAVLVNYGIASVPLTMNYTGMLLITFIGVLIVNLGANLASVKIKRVSPRVLTAE